VIASSFNGTCDEILRQLAAGGHCKLKKITSTPRDPSQDKAISDTQREIIKSAPESIEKMQSGKKNGASNK
jgi:hypothetical protein